MYGRSPISLTRWLALAAIAACIAPAAALACTQDADCPGTMWCNETSQVCTAKLANGTAMPTDPPHVSPTLDGTCTAAAASLVCVSSVCDNGDNACGFANEDGPCTVGNGGVVCRSGSCSVNGKCQPVGGCNVDADCSAGNWCTESTHTCTPQLANGASIPVDPPHTSPTLNGTCTAIVGQLVCASGVCDVTDNACGYLDGDGPCTTGNGPVICRSGTCNADNQCGPLATTTTTSTSSTTSTTVPEDSGFVPPDVATLKCEAAVAKAAAKQWAAIAKCHSKAASAALASRTFDEEGCEAAAAAKFDKSTGNLKACPPCVQGASLTAIRTYVETTGDATNGMFYCAGTTPFP